MHETAKLINELIGPRQAAEQPAREALIRRATAAALEASAEAIALISTNRRREEK